LLGALFITKWVRGEDKSASDFYTAGGWPVITFLMAARLLNLGKLPSPTLAAFRFQQTPHIRIFAASGTFGGGLLQSPGCRSMIRPLFGLGTGIAVVIVGALMMVYVLFGGMTATWVQIARPASCWVELRSWRCRCCGTSASAPRPCSPAQRRSRLGWH
jgi:Na+(H+)/acetate symporter ActP